MLSKSCISSSLTEIGKWLDQRLIAFLFIGLAIFTVIALALGKPLEFFAYLFGGSIIIWLANRRARAMEDSVRMAERGQTISRFESALKLLENDHAPVIVGAVYALHWITREEPNYLGPVFDVLCELIREKDTNLKNNAKKTAANLIFSDDGSNSSIIYPNKANLVGANLSDWDLSEMTLASAKLRSADLSGANLRGTDLTGANLTEAKIDRVKVNGKTNLQHANLQGIDVSSTDLSGIDFSDADMRTGGRIQSSFKHVNFTGCDFNGAKLDNARFDGSNFKDAKNLTYSQLSTVRSLVEVDGLTSEMENDLKKYRPQIFEKDK